MALILVPTPLGNLQDITLHALETLRNAALIVAEDTRVTRKLLSAYEINVRELQTYNEFTSESGIAAILARARDEVVAVVSDAGMPGVCDPGTQLLTAARNADIAVAVLPGPSAFVSAAVLSGFPLQGMSFEGFVPRGDGEKRTLFRTILSRARTSVWYESPHRIVDTLELLARECTDLSIFLIREYTKHFEQQLFGTPGTVLAGLPDPIRGEFVFVCDGRSYREPTTATATIEERIDALLAQGMTAASVAKRLAAEGAGSRNALYIQTIERGKRISDAENA